MSIAKISVMLAVTHILVVSAMTLPALHCASYSSSTACPRSSTDVFLVESLAAGNPDVDREGGGRHS